jgi:hypothetical protein
MTDKSKYVVEFNGGSFDRTWDELNKVFNRYGKGDIVAYEKNNLSFVVQDVEDAAVEDIKKLRGFKSIEKAGASK